MLSKHAFSVLSKGTVGYVYVSNVSHHWNCVLGHYLECSTCEVDGSPSAKSSVFVQCHLVMQMYPLFLSHPPVQNDEWEFLQCKYAYTSTFIVQQSKLKASLLYLPNHDVELICHLNSVIDMVAYGIIFSGIC